VHIVTFILQLTRNYKQTLL